SYQACHTRISFFFFFQAEDGIRDFHVTGVQTCALPIFNAIRVRPAANVTPQKFETGTQNHEGIAGTLGAVEHYEDIARLAAPNAKGLSRRERIVAAFDAINQYEEPLTRLMLDRLQAVPGLTVYGITDPTQLHPRLSTFSLRMGDHAPRDIATYLAARGINVSHGNVYGINVTE